MATLRGNSWKKIQSCLVQSNDTVWLLSRYIYFNILSTSNWIGQYVVKSCNFICLKLHCQSVNRNMYQLWWKKFLLLYYYTYFYLIILIFPKIYYIIVLNLEKVCKNICLNWNKHPQIDKFLCQCFL